MNTTQSLPHRVGFRVLTITLTAVGLLGGLPTVQAQQEQVIFTIDPTQSVVTDAGKDHTYGAFGPASTLSAPVSGHFVVDFDPSTDTPSSIEFQSSAGGFYSLATPYTLTPGIGGSGPAALANLGGSAGPVSFAQRNLTYDYSRAPITPSFSSGTTSTFTATSTIFHVLSGSFDYVDGAPGTIPETGVIGTLSSGAWTLTDSPANSGNWTLSLNAGTIPTSYSSTTSGSTTITGNVVSTAKFSLANVAQAGVAGSTTAQVLGGSGVVGGVSIVFQNSPITASQMTVQTLNSLAGTTHAAEIAAQGEPAFLLSTSPTAIGTPQIWSFNYNDTLLNGSATVTFHYDPSLLPAGADPNNLEIYHFDSGANMWEELSVVGRDTDTITVITPSFSDFALANAVPEPATIALVGSALLVIGGMQLVRRRALA